MSQQPATGITLSSQEQAIVEQIIRQASNPQWLVTRAKIVLKAGSGHSTRGIAAELGLTGNTVRLWRERWQATAKQRLGDGAEIPGQPSLRERIEASLQDEPGRGGPVKFSAEQVVRIVAISCEEVTTSSYPVSHWTPKEVAAEAVKRGIVTSISLRQVGRFLK